MPTDLIEPHRSLTGQKARNLATATVTAPQNAEATPRWLLRLLPWVDVNGGVYRVNRRDPVVPRAGRISTHLDGDAPRVKPGNLQNIPLFHGLSHDALEGIAGQLTPEQFAAGAVIANEGDAYQKLIIIATGKIELSINGPHGDKLSQGLLGAGSFFSEEALVNDGWRSPAIRALISRLVKEFYAETASGAPATSGAPSGSLGDFSGITPAGSVPPVHPSVQPPLEKSEESSPEHYAFGEPNPDSWRLKGLRGEQLDPYPNSSEASQGSRDGSGLYFLPDFRDASTESAATYPTFDTGLPHFSLPFAKAGAPLAGFDVEKVRRDFPALHQKVNGRDLIWFDNAATTHKPQSVIDAISLFYSRDNSNVNRAAHTLARRATDIYEGAREKVREFIGAGDTDEIIFVRGTTEAINLVAQTFGRQRIGAGDEILLTTMEHHANIVPWKMLSEQTGANIRVAPINDRGELLLDQFASLLSERTKIVAITHVSNALGTINPLEEVIALAHAYGIPVLVDGAQSTPHLPVNVQALDADFFAFSGHKIFGPTGIGILYGKREFLETIPPYQGGGSMIEDVTFSKITYAGIPQKFEAGTQDIAAVAGLAAAIDYVLGIGLPAIAAYEHELLEYATAELQGVQGIRQIGTAASKASVLSFVVNGVESEKVGTYLDDHGIAVRAGHHCAQPSLRRFGVETAVRPSFAFYNTREEIDVLIRALHQLPKR